ncbi:hypothetical protein BC835DRAFT_1407858 [Cytidiella melzeri]|nr:hypothetical protein BC835DRAFT_1407858 [Cytidiella melzeri]
MSTPLPPDVPRNVALIIRVQYVGSLMAFLLFGISIMQFYHYSMNYPKDHLMIKVTVFAVFALDTFQSISVAALAYYSLCSGWGRPVALIQLNWTYPAIPGVTGIIAAWVQTFYAWRIYKIGQWRILPAFIIGIALMQCAGALSITGGIPPLPDVTALHLLYRRTIVWLGGAAAADVIIAVVMLYLLYTVRRNKFQHTQRVINRLIRLTVETGVVTATCAIMELIMFQALPATNMHIFFAAMLAKVYYNALMTSLNTRSSRDRSSRDLEPGGATSQQYSTASFSRSGLHHETNNMGNTLGFHAGSGASRGGVVPPTVVHIATVTDREADYGYEEDVKSHVVLGSDVDSHHGSAFPMTRMSGTTITPSSPGTTPPVPRF